MEELSQEEKEIIKVYRRLVKETNSKNWIICNPEMMWSTYFVPISLIEKKIEELSGMVEVGDITREMFNRIEYAIEVLVELLDERNNTDEN